MACYKGDIEAVKRHLAAGEDVNEIDGGRTPLHVANLLGGHQEIAELFIAKRADVNAKKDDGRTPLDNAIKYKRPEIADLLRKHGAKTAKELKAEGK